MATTKEVWTEGRKGCTVLLEITEYDNGRIVASAEGDKITYAMLAKALRKEYPRHTFYAARGDGYIYAHANTEKIERRTK